MNKLAIATSSGGYKGVFIHGVLSLFEQKNFQADAYASCSSSALFSALASIKKINTISNSIWSEGNEIAKIKGNSQSNVQLMSINKLFPILKDELFKSPRRYLVSTSFVKNENAALETQSELSVRLGRKLLIEAARNIETWRDENLEHHLFDTCNNSKTKLLTEENLKDVLYATTRMLHAWHIPAFVNEKPYIDGSYTSMCPVHSLAELEYEKIICITTENNQTKLDFFSDKYIPEKIGDSDIIFIKPDYNLSEIDVDFFKVTELGLDKAFQHGIEKAKEFLKIHGNNYKS
jgi:predicted patatin/cPLA2 family phospholipase